MWANAVAVRSTCLVDIAVGVNGVIGDLLALADWENGV